MASVNGVSIKNVVEFKGHEGEPLFQCDVYYLNKKVGTFSQDSWGGTDDLRVPQDIQDLFKDYKSTSEYADDDEIFRGMEWLIYDVYALKQDEKIFNKNVKKGYPITVVVDDWMFGTSLGVRNMESLSDDEIITKVRAHLLKQSQDYGKVATKNFRVIRSIDAFTVVGSAGGR